MLLIGFSHRCILLSIASPDVWTHPRWEGNLSCSSAARAVLKNPCIVCLLGFGCKQEKAALANLSRKGNLLKRYWASHGIFGRLCIQVYTHIGVGSKLASAIPGCSHCNFPFTPPILDVGHWPLPEILHLRLQTTTREHSAGLLPHTVIFISRSRSCALIDLCCLSCRKGSGSTFSLFFSL